MLSFLRLVLRIGSSHKDSWGARNADIVQRDAAAAGHALQASRRSKAECQQSRIRQSFCKLHILMSGRLFLVPASLSQFL